jgi:cysteine desulfurase
MKRGQNLNKKIYMDYGATTPVDPKIITAMRPFFEKSFGNPSSIHSYGLDASEMISESRQHVASIIGAHKDEIIFTSGGTESDNLAIKGIAYKHLDKRKTKGPHILTSLIEHPAVLEPIRYLEKIGFSIAYIPVDSTGLIDPKQVEENISENTFLVSIMTANNEIGTIEPIREIGRITKKHGVLFHTDAVQAIGKVPLDVKKDSIDLLSLSSHKIYGPKGVGALYVKDAINLEPLFHGGGHEKGMRSGTLNTPGIIGLGKACKLARNRFEKDTKHLEKLRDTLIENVLRIEESYLNGHPTKRLVNNAHFRFTAIEGESLHMMLDREGIAAATGSACSSKKLKPSHVLLALGLTPEESHGSIRFSIGRTSTIEDIEYVSEKMMPIVESLRKMSPLWNKEEITR